MTEEADWMESMMEDDDDQYTFEAHVRGALWLSVKQEYRAFLEIKRNRNYTWEEPPTQKRVRLYGEYVHVVSSCCQGCTCLCKKPKIVPVKGETVNDHQDPASGEQADIYPSRLVLPTDGMDATTREQYLLELFLAICRNKFPKRVKDITRGRKRGRYTGG